jgi:hypothetical protein
VTVTPVKARCTRCRGDFALAELLDRRDGCCPRCGGRLTDDWTAVLLDEARRVGLAQEHHATALRRHPVQPRTQSHLPHPVVPNLVDALGWEEPADDDLGVLDDQRKLLTELAARWERDEHPGRQRTRRPRWSRRARRGARHRVYATVPSSVVKEPS